MNTEEINFNASDNLTAEESSEHRQAVIKKIQQLNSFGYFKHLFVVFIITLIIAYNSDFERLPFETFKKGNIFYTKNVSKSEINLLGYYLMKSKFFDGTPKSVKLDKSEGGNYIISLVIKEEFKDKPQYTENFKLFTYEVSEALGKKTDVNLCDSYFKTYNTIKYNDCYKSLRINSTQIVYSPAIKEKMIRDMAKAFIYEKIIDGNPKTFILSMVKRDLFELKVPIKKEYRNFKLNTIFFKIISGKLIFEVLKTKVNVILCNELDWTPYETIFYYDALKSFEMNENKFAHSNDINEKTSRKIADTLSEMGLFDKKDSIFVMHTLTTSIPNITIVSLSRTVDEAFIKNAASRLSRECLDGQNLRIDMRDQSYTLLKTYYQPATQVLPPLPDKNQAQPSKEGKQ